MQAMSLAQLIDKGVAKGRFIVYFAMSTHHRHTDSYIGMAIVGGAVAVGAVLVTSLLRRASRK